METSNILLLMALRRNSSKMKFGWRRPSSMPIAEVAPPATLWWDRIAAANYGPSVLFRLMTTRQHGVQLPGGEANHVSKPGMGDHDEETQEH